MTIAGGGTLVTFPALPHPDRCERREHGRVGRQTQTPLTTRSRFTVCDGEISLNRRPIGFISPHAKNGCRVRQTVVQVQNHGVKERATGLEPATSSLGSVAKLTESVRKPLIFNGRRPARFHTR